MQLWLSSGLKLHNLMVWLAPQEHEFFQGRSSPMDQACPSLDHGDKPSAQWALNPSTLTWDIYLQGGEDSKAVLPSCQGHCEAPSRRLGALRREGGPSCCLHRSPSGTLCSLLSACHGRVSKPRTPASPHPHGYLPAANCNLASRTQHSSNMLPFPTPAVWSHLLAVGSDTWRLQTCTGLVFSQDQTPHTKSQC